MTDMTQAPTPGPLSGDDVKLLVKGDLLQWRGTAISLVSFHHANVMGVQVIDLRDGRRWTASPTALSFIGRPEPDAWSDHATIDCICVTTGNGSEGCGLCNETGLRPSLAPTALVEASGSERDDRLKGVRSMLERVIGPTASVRIYEHEAKLILDALRSQPSGFLATLTDEQRTAALSHTGGDTHPQPSGEAREAVARIIDPASWELWDARPTFLPSSRLDSFDKADAIFALLCARPAPVASGGQHSSGEGFGLTANDIAGIIEQNADADADGLHNASQLAEKIYRSLTKPVPAQDDDRGMKAFNFINDLYRIKAEFPAIRLHGALKKAEALAALKSTAAQEGGE